MQTICKNLQDIFFFKCSRQCLLVSQYCSKPAWLTYLYAKPPAFDHKFDLYEKISSNMLSEEHVEAYA